MSTLTDEMLRQIMPHCSKARRAQCMPHLVSAMIEFEITNYLRAAAFLATIALESGELKYFEELASGAAYEGRRDLGNIYRGDGRKYKGRGVIQVTGRTNSEACLKFLRLPAGQPERLAEMQNAFRSAGWFWGPFRHLNQLADQRQFLAIQVRVNGRNKATGLPNHWKERSAYYSVALRVLPEDLHLTEDSVADVLGSSVLNENHIDNGNSDAVLATAAGGVGVGVGTAVALDDEGVMDSETGDVPELADAATAADVPAAPAPGTPGLDLAPVEGGGPNDAPVAIVAAAPAKERSMKSLVSTLTAGLGSVGLTIGALATRVADWIHGNPALVVLFALAIIAVVVCYLLYQYRQTKLDLADRESAKQVTLETMRIRADPRLINVQVVPQAVPAEGPKD